MHHSHLSSPPNRGFPPICDRPDPHTLPRHNCHFARSRPISSLLEHHRLHTSFHVITLCSLLTACFRIFAPHLSTICVPMLFKPSLKQSKSKKSTYATFSHPRRPVSTVLTIEPISQMDALTQTHTHMWPMATLSPFTLGSRHYY
jgi:hypothetical protein